MLLTKASAASNVESTVTGPKIVDLPSGQKDSIINPTIISTPIPDLHTIRQQEEFSQANQLSSIEEDLAKVLEIVEKFEVESDFPLSVKGNLRHNIKFWKSIGDPLLYIIDN